MNIEILFELTANKVTARAFREEINRQLQEAGNKKDFSLLNFLNQKNKNGNTLLHVAAAMGNFELVEELIGLGLKVEIKNDEGKTASNVAHTHQIKALLKTRGKWLALAKGFDASRVIHMLDEARSGIAEANSIAKLLFIGPTGSGKSTYMNSRFGVVYKSTLAGGCRPEATVTRKGDKAVAPVGHGIHSTTTFPYARELPSNPFAYVDLAGLCDNRDIEHKIVAASTTQWVANMPGGIQGILVFIDLPTIQAKNADGLRDVADAVYKMCKGDEAVLSAVRYIVTKIRTKRFARRVTIETLNQEYLDAMLEDAVDKDNKSVQFILNDMVNNGDKVFLSDLSARSGKKIDAAFKTLKPRLSDKFNFMSHDDAQQNFKDFLKAVPDKYFEIERRIKAIPFELAIAEEARVVLDAKSRQLKDEMNELIIQRDNPFRLGISERDFGSSIRQLGGIDADLDMLSQKAKTTTSEHEHKILSLKTEYASREKTRLESNVNTMLRDSKVNHLRYFDAAINAKSNLIAENKKQKCEVAERIQQLKAEKVSLKLDLEVNQNLFKSVSRTLQDLNIHESNTAEFIAAVEAKPKSTVSPAAFWRKPVSTPSQFQTSHHYAQRQFN